MTLDTNSLPIIAVPPVRRNTPVRHRRTVTGWQLERVVRLAQAWLAQPVRATRAQHAKVAALYGTVAVAVALVVEATAR